MKQQEKQYQIGLTDFIEKNPSANENFYIKNRIKDLKAVLKEWYKTADFNVGEELDGSEFINGVLTVTKTGTASDYFYFDSELKFLKHKRTEIKEPKQPEAVKPDEKYKTQNLFKVGLLFATGEMNKYFTINGKNETVIKVGYTAPKIANDFENNSFNKWILATINNYPTDNPNANKNIFNNIEMMNNIIDHCKAKNILVSPYFISRLPID